MVREIIKKLKKSRDKENIVIIELIDELKEEYLKEWKKQSNLLY